MSPDRKKRSRSVRKPRASRVWKRESPTAIRRYILIFFAAAAILFGVALLASGLSSSSVGTLAGQIVMQGFIRRQIPLFLRRVVTMLPALILIAVGLDPSRSLVLSQVVLSFGIPFALVPLLLFCRNRQLMGALVNRRVTTGAAAVVAGIIVTLNAYLVAATFGLA